MGLEEQAVGADCHGRPRQRFDHRPIPAGDGAKAARRLDAVGGVEDDGDAKGLHLGDGPHVADQPAVAEEGPAFAQEDAAAAGGLELGDDVCHVPWGEKLSLFYVDRPARAPGGGQKVGLPGEKRRDLQQVAHLGDRGRMFRQVDVRRRR